MSRVMSVRGGGSSTCCRHLRSAVTVTELLQPRDLAFGTLFHSSCAIQTSPTYCSDDSWRDTFLGKHEHSALWLLKCGAMEKHLLIYLLTYLLIKTFPQKFQTKQILWRWYSKPFDENGRTLDVGICTQWVPLDTNTHRHQIAYGLYLYHGTHLAYQLCINLRLIN